jgi:hypothetical protein
MISAARGAAGTMNNSGRIQDLAFKRFEVDELSAAGASDFQHL